MDCVHIYWLRVVFIIIYLGIRLSTLIRRSRCWQHFTNYACWLLISIWDCYNFYPEMSLLTCYWILYNHKQINEVVRECQRPIKLKCTWLDSNVGLKSFYPNTLEAIEVSWRVRRIPLLWDILESPNGAYHLLGKPGCYRMGAGVLTNQRLYAGNSCTSRAI